MAPAAGFEPATIRLTVERSTAELRRNIVLGNYNYFVAERQSVSCLFVSARFQAMQNCSQRL